VALVDCPVSGGVARAVTGELSMMAGGDAGSLQRVAPLLSAIGTSIHHCGPTGAGKAMKALNNLVSAGGFLVAPFSALRAQLWASAANVLGPGRDHTEMACFSEAVAGLEVA
jgi:3-hydroxyisobutyrate dehydrogenase-like beta-hydroxyacid dehydrogenase